MPTYAALLGHQPNLSLAELAARVPEFSLDRVIQKKWAIFDCPNALPDNFIDTIGGTILIAESVSSEPLAVEDVPLVLKNELKDKRGKLVFALRCENVPKAVVRSLYRNGKQRIKDLGRICRYIGSDRKPALPVQLHDEEIISGKRGCEIVVITEPSVDADDSVPPLEMDAWIGSTIAAQNIDSYSKRDMQKPVRDTAVGLLPPKLAQIMVSFGEWLAREEGKGKESGGKRNKRYSITVLDPFCGTGVIPMECLLRSFHVQASDVAMKAVNGCKKNIEWIRKEEKILKKDATSDVWKQDATKAFDLKEPPDVIVTETTLGPALSKRPGAADAKKNRTACEKIEATFLKNAGETLPGVPIAMILPFWRLKTGPIFLEKIWKAIDDAGFQAVLPPGITPDREGVVSILYRRPDQFVGREIVLLKCKKK